VRSLVQVQDGPFMFGGLAQLVERLLCKQDVSGSSPLTSTQRGPTDRTEESCWDDDRRDKGLLEGIQPPIMPKRVEWMLNSACPEREMCSAKNLDNCIGESGKKASHGCLVPKLRRG
jgi:hypothetical protein